MQNNLALTEVRKKYYQIFKENQEQILNAWMSVLEDNVPDIISLKDTKI